MGNHSRFRLSDMMPNAWFYKLKDMSNRKITSSSSSLARPTNKNHPSKLPHLSDQRKSYYITRDNPTSPLKTTDKHDFPIEPPRKSSRRRRTTNRSHLNKIQPTEPRLVSSTTLDSVYSQKDQTFSSDEHGSTLTEYGSDRSLISADDKFSSPTNSCKCRSGNDVVNINMDGKDHASGFDQRDLPPIITKKQHQHQKSAKNPQISPFRRFSSASPGVKLRNTPRIADRRIQGRKSVSGGSRPSVSESFAVVKSSKDPGREFKESMVEMIVENNIRATEDLEELLACYLLLNSDEYHELIINVFKQIWIDFVRFRLNY